MNCFFSIDSLLCWVPNFRCGNAEFTADREIHHSRPHCKLKSSEIHVMAFDKRNFTYIWKAVWYVHLVLGATAFVHNMFMVLLRSTTLPADELYNVICKQIPQYVNRSLCMRDIQFSWIFYTILRGDFR